VWQPDFPGEIPLKNVTARIIASASYGGDCLDPSLNNGFGDPVQGWQSVGMHIVTVDNPDHKTRVEFPAYSLSASATVEGPSPEASVEVSLFAYPDDHVLTIASDLPGRFPAENEGHWLQPSDDKKFIGYAIRGFRDDSGFNSDPTLWDQLGQVPYYLGWPLPPANVSAAETPLVPHIQGYAEFSAFVTPGLTSPTYTWSVGGGTIKRWDYWNPETQIATSTYTKHLHFDLGPLTLQNLYSFPKKTTVNVTVSGDDPDTITLKGKAEVTWRPRLSLFSLVGGNLDDWDPTSELIEEYINRQRAIIQTGAALMGTALDLLCIQAAQDLMFNGLLHGIQAVADIRRATTLVMEPKYIGKAHAVSVNYANDTLNILGWDKKVTNVLVIGDANLVAAAQRDLEGARYVIKTVDDLPEALRGSQAWDDIAKATAGEVVRSEDDIARLMQGGAWGNWERLEEAQTARCLEQSHQNSCGPTCVAMILRDLGHNKTEQDMVAIVGQELTIGDQLAFLLNGVDATKNWHSRWIPPQNRELLLQLTNFPPFIAMLKEFEKDAHWIIIDGLTPAGKVRVRDPSTGTEYLMTLETLLEFWQGNVVGRFP
jgi:hypothetical protein